MTVMGITSPCCGDAAGSGNSPAVHNGDFHVRSCCPKVAEFRPILRSMSKRRLEGHTCYDSQMIVSLDIIHDTVQFLNAVFSEWSVTLFLVEAHL